MDLPDDGGDAKPAGDVSLGRSIGSVAAALARFGHPASLAAAVAEAVPERVARIAYIAGTMLPSGQRFAQVIAAMLPQHPDAAGIGPRLLWSHDRAESWVPRLSRRGDARPRRGAGRTGPDLRPGAGCGPGRARDRPRPQRSASRRLAEVPLPVLAPGTSLAHPSVPRTIPAASDPLREPEPR